MTTEQHGYFHRWSGALAPQLPLLIGALRQVGWLPEVASWWFGWCELQIALPGRLTTASVVPTDWDVIHLFSERTELRWVRRGDHWQAVLLAETALPTGLVDWQPLVNAYTARRTQRILVGNRLRLPDGNSRGIIQFPRRLDYNLADEAEKLDQAIVADVWAYYDGEARLQTVRYAKLRHTQPGVQSEKESSRGIQ